MQFNPLEKKLLVLVIFNQNLNIFFCFCNGIPSFSDDISLEALAELNHALPTVSCSVSQSLVCGLRSVRTSKAMPPKCIKDPPKCMRCSAFAGFLFAPPGVPDCRSCRIATVRDESCLTGRLKKLWSQHCSYLFLYFIFYWRRWWECFTPGCAGLCTSGLAKTVAG